MYEVWICHNFPGVTLSWNVTDSLWFGLFFLNSRQKQLEAIKQLQEDAVNQEVILGKKVQEASQRLEAAGKQVGQLLTMLYSGEVSSAVLKTMK